MAKRRFAQVVACLMAVMLPGMMLAADMSSAMVYTNGPVLVNGTGVSRTTTIFAGDRLQVPAQSAATITARGSSVTVAPGSVVTFRGDVIALEARSAVSISTTEGLAAQVHKLTIAPAGKSETKFQVVRLNGSVVISAKMGAVEITENEGSAKRKGGTVTEGKTATVPDPDAQAPAGGPAAAGAGTPGATVGGYVVGLAAVGAGVGAAIATTGLPNTPPKTPVSPVRP